jgi:uncharacterized protein
MSAVLVLLFALTALIYASVGFGGGSSYTALLTLSGIDKALIPVISLGCNIVVVTGGVIRFYRAGLYEWRKLLPLLIVSAPLAFLGGLTPLKQAVFLTILGGTLLLSALALFLPVERLPQRRLGQPVLVGISAIVGLLAGLSGIGGGIFIAPILHIVRWDEAKRIAAFASLYILVNSIAGLSGQLIKLGIAGVANPFGTYWPLLLAVLAGGQIGGTIGLKFFSPLALKRATGLLVAYAAIYLLWKTWS